MTDHARPDAPAAAVSAPGTAAVPLAPAAHLDAALRRLLPVVVHDLRNGLGVVGVQLEALQLRAFGPRADEALARGHGDAAAHAVEGLAAQLDAIATVARGEGDDLAAVTADAAALVPLRRIALGAGATPPTALSPPLLRALVLELLVHALEAPGPWALEAGTDGAARPRLVVRAGRPLTVPAAAERLVQETATGASLSRVEGALVLTCPPA